VLLELEDRLEVLEEELEAFPYLQLSQRLAEVAGMLRLELAVMVVLEAVLWEAVELRVLEIHPVLIHLKEMMELKA
jgi:hypothetical protein